TSMAMSVLLLGGVGGVPREARRDRVRGANAGSPPGIPDGGRVGSADLDVLLRHGAVDDAEAAELHLVTGQAGARAVVPGGDEDVVGLRLRRIADVGARGVRLGGG